MLLKLSFWMELWRSVSALSVPTLIACQLVMNAGIFLSLSRLQQKGVSWIPDIQPGGYSPQHLYRLYQAWGDEGRQGYMFLALADLLVLIPMYTVLLGGTIIKTMSYHELSSSIWKIRESLVSLVLGIALADLVETIPNLFACYIFPFTAPDAVLRLARLGTWVKFFLLGLYWILFSWVLGVAAWSQLRKHFKIQRVSYRTALSPTIDGTKPQ